MLKNVKIIHTRPKVEQNGVWHLGNEGLTCSGVMRN